MQLLLVEDDLELGAALHAALRQAGYSSTWVRTLEDGMRHFDASVHAAVLLDVKLPDGLGFELLLHLRRHAIGVPVLMITARDGLEDRLRGLHNGADDYIVKPFAVAELLARLDAVQRRFAGHAQSEWRVGVLCISPMKRQVVCEERQVHLTRREFDILIELARSATQVVRRESLVQRVWGSQADVFDSTLDVHIHSLRRKIAPAHIHTVRGVGYLLESSCPIG